MLHNKCKEEGKKISKQHFVKHQERFIWDMRCDLIALLMMSRGLLVFMFGIIMKMHGIELSMEVEEEEEDKL